MYHRSIHLAIQQATLERDGLQLTKLIVEALMERGRLGFNSSHDRLTQLPRGPHHGNQPAQVLTQSPIYSFLKNISKPYLPAAEVLVPHHPEPVRSTIESAFNILCHASPMPSDEPDHWVIVWKAA